MAILAASENAGFEEHPVLFVTAAAIMLLVLWQILWPRGGERAVGRFSPRRIGIFNAAKLIVAAIALIAATSERVLLSVGAGACVIALVAWEAWWWRGRSDRRSPR